eukprot:1715574-Rhodomonas_salina.1
MAGGEGADAEAGGGRRGAAAERGEGGAAARAREGTLRPRHHPLPPHRAGQPAFRVCLAQLSPPEKKRRAELEDVRAERGGAAGGAGARARAGARLGRGDRARGRPGGQAEAERGRQDPGSLRRERRDPGPQDPEGGPHHPVR